MAGRRAFYVVQGGLHVVEHGRTGTAAWLAFADSDDGLRSFDAYLQKSGAQPSLVLVDVIEEVFTTDRIPKLASGDRADLLQRRLQRKYARTPYRLATYRKPANSEDPSAVYSAISNRELLDPWLSIVARHFVPLVGIYSVPLMAPDMLVRLFKSPGPTLLVSHHQSDKLRQSFVQDRLVKSARLSQAPLVDSDEYPHFVIMEIQRSRRYLERARLLSGMEQLDVCMVVNSEVASQIIAHGESDTPIRMHFLSPEVAAKRLHVGSPEDDRLESLYVESALHRRPKHNYAVSGETRYWQMSRMRRAIIAAGFATAAACSLFAGTYLGDAWRLYREATNIDAQVAQLSAAYRRENENYAPIKAGSYEMKLAVDTGDYILQQRVPVAWVMQQLGAVLGEHRQVRLRGLRWEAEAAAVADQRSTRRADPAAPVAIPETTAVAVEVSASIEPFDGDMRRAFRQIDRLVDDISKRTAFSEARAIEYPVDASPKASVTGEIGGNQRHPQADFRLRLRFPVASGSLPSSEQGDDAV